jgi:hypothetical protein
LRHVEREKEMAMAILGQIVPQAELFLKSSGGASSNVKGGGEDPRKKQLQIKRFDPTDPESYALVVNHFSLHLNPSNLPLDLQVK